MSIENRIAKYWRPLEDGRIECNLCPRGCKLREGQRGLCFVRRRENDQIFLATYNRSSGYCIDPVEKKPLYHFLPGTPTLSFGTAGCNLSCIFCQNWHISRSKEMEILSDWATPASIARAARDLGCSSVSFTYNDPVIFLEYAIDTAEACHALGIRTIAVTAGYIEEKPRIEFFKHMDATNVDLKAFTERFYKKLCAGKLKPVLETLLYIKNKTKVWLEITNLIIPGENDSEKEIEEMSHWIYENLGSDVPLHFSAFHPDSKMMDRPATQPSTIKKAQKIAQKNGLNHSYTGNISDVNGQTTFCSKCNEPLIERKGYNISFYNLNNINECKFCRHKIAGVFNSEPGQWGSRRQPVRMADFQ